MAKFVWQDGTLVSKAKVEINGTIYEVDPEEYSGTTPLSATNLNAMVDQTYADLKKYIDDKGVYSSDETLIGTYDNKPYYMRKYTVTSINTGSYQTLTLDSSYDVQEYDAYLHRTNGRKDKFVGNGNYDYSPLLATVRSTGIEYYVGNAYGTGAEKIEFIIKYTKN